MEGSKRVEWDGYSINNIMNTQTLRIGSTDVVLYDYQKNQGKIIISDDNYGYNFSYYWGSMGSDLKDFLLHINKSYFVGKLGPVERGSIDIKVTMKNVRHWWKTESGIAWYNEMELQKDLRREFKIIEQLCNDETDFVSRMQNITNAFYFPKTMFTTDFEDALIAIKSEPWHHLEYKEHKQNTWLNGFFVRLQDGLKSI